MDQEPKILVEGKYRTIPELVKQYGKVNMKFVPSNNSIQVRDINDKWLGNLKYDYTEEEKCQ